MVLFAVSVPLSMVLLAYGVYWLVAAVEHFTWGLGLPATYGAAIANVLVLMAGVVMTTAAALTVGERKWSAMIQNRIGPNRIKVFGLSVGGIFFLAADALKMLTKENIEPDKRSRVLYELAPMAAFVPSFVLGAASLAVYGTALAGWASNSKLAILGGVRASSQMISYEVSLGLSLVGSMMAYQSLRLEEMVQAQGHLLWGFLPALGFFLQPVGMLVFFVSAFAETKRAPFDLPEGESEIVGYFVEYPGMKFGMMFLAEFIEVVVLAAITSAIFFGGWHPVFFEQTMKEAVGEGTIWWAAICAGAFLGKVLLLCWKMLLPITLGNVFLTGALILIDPSLELLAVVGLVELVAMVLLTAAASRKGELPVA